MLTTKTRKRLEKMYVKYYKQFNPGRTVPLSYFSLQAIDSCSLLGLFEDLTPNESIPHSVVLFKLKCYEEIA